MKDIYLINFSVKGIKSLDQLVSLSFYKKTITNDPDTRKYNIKGIYGMNGSGKSGIVLAVKILKNLIINTDYLNNPIMQRTLDAIINKHLNSLFLQAEYMIHIEGRTLVFMYTISLTKDATGKYRIVSECLKYRKTLTTKNQELIVYEVENGELLSCMQDDNKYIDLLKKRTMNLLSTASLCALFYEKIIMERKKTEDVMNSAMYFGLFWLYGLGMSMHVFMDESDNHKNYFFRKSFLKNNDIKNNGTEIAMLTEKYVTREKETLTCVSVMDNVVIKELYPEFKNIIERLYNFIHIFKNDLLSIEIDKKEDQFFYICNLVMVYEDYKIYAEFESTGVKKLIELFAYLNEMVNGGIVFIDEFDSNLHDVYLCALLEYLMEYGEGQLCFTTHNVGPMDILKQHKKSIDFLSMDHKIYPWIKSGNYSPANLYRNGMIEGSPFNVDSIDFIGVLDFSEEDL